MENILIAVTGMTPAVVTETLYAINRDSLPWPDKILILTTQKGMKKLTEGLPAAIDGLCHEYELPPLNEDRIDIKVIPDSSGNAIDDARSREDHEVLGDFIMQTVRDIAADDNIAIHASIAGGRKTMTYYLGYAMSLFGRQQDYLSHVLISEAHENLPGFYYPTRKPLLLKHFNGETHDASQAEVMLADIPFIRLRDSLPKILLGTNRPIKLRDLVNSIELGEREIIDHGIRLELGLDFCGLRISSAAGHWQKDIPLKSIDYAIYRVLIRPQLSDNTACYNRPTDNTTKDVDLAYATVEEIGRMFKQSTCDEMLLSDIINQLRDFEATTVFQRLDPRTLSDLEDGLSCKKFDARLHDINSVLEKELPNKLYRWLELRQIQDKNGIPLGFYNSEKWPRGKKGGRYGIALQANQITLSD